MKIPSVTQRANNVHQQTCTSRWAYSSKEWRVFSTGHKCVYHLWKWSAEKLHFWVFPGNCCISETAEKLQKLFGSALSRLIICYCWDLGPGVCPGDLPDAENCLPVVHMCWCTLAALLVREGRRVFFMPYDPSLYGIFVGHISWKWGVGVVEYVFWGK